MFPPGGNMAVGQGYIFYKILWLGGGVKNGAGEKK